jgi:hypothetical protein
MEDNILPNPPPEAPAQPAPAQQPTQTDLRFDRLEQAMGQLAGVVQDAANRLTQAPQQATPQTNDEFLNELAQNPQAVIQRVAADTFRRTAQETLNPAVLKVLDTSRNQLMERERERVDGDFGEGAFDEIFRPQLNKDLDELRQHKPDAIADPATVRALVDRLYGGDNFPVLLERRANLEKNARMSGRSHLLPSGGVPRLRGSPNPQEEIPPDAEQFLREVERNTGEAIDRKQYARLYHTGVETGPGRHRTTIVDYLKATGADPDKLKMYGGERS